MLSPAGRDTVEPVTSRGEGQPSSPSVPEVGPDDPGSARAGPGGLWARAVDAVFVLTTAGVVVALAQLPAWRAVFSSAAVVLGLACLFVFRYGRGHGKLPIGILLVLLAVASLVTVWLQPTSSAAPAPAPSPGVSPLRVTMSGLRTGDCIVGDDLKLDDNDADWPRSTLVVSCDTPHHGEVILATDMPFAETYAGDDTVSDQAGAQCRRAFREYVGVDWKDSILDYVFSKPTEGDWESGNRHLYCVAYEPQELLTTTVRRLGR